MGVYRVEASPNNRAGCHAAPCKQAGIKITKGELRYAIQVTINEHQSWQYRHWGCVTPKQMENLLDTCGGNTDMVDGYDELPVEYQEKIEYALENGHVHDDDWKGDVELNRPGKSGIKKRTPKKKAATKDAEHDDGTNDNDDAEEKPKKKRAAPKAKAKTVDDADDIAAPAPKKRGRPFKKEADAEQDEDAAAPPAKKRGRPAKKVEYKEESDDEEAPKPKKARSKKAAVKAEESEDVPEEEDAEEEEEAPKPKRGSKKQAAPTDSEAKVPAKRGRKKKKSDD